MLRAPRNRGQAVTALKTTSVVEGHAPERATRAVIRAGRRADVALPRSSAGRAARGEGRRTASCRVGADGQWRLMMPRPRTNQADRRCRRRYPAHTHAHAATRAARRRTHVAPRAIGGHCTALPSAAVGADAETEAEEGPEAAADMSDTRTRTPTRPRGSARCGAHEAPSAIAADAETERPSA